MWVVCRVGGTFLKRDNIRNIRDRIFKCSWRKGVQRLQIYWFLQLKKKLGKGFLHCWRRKVLILYRVSDPDRIVSGCGLNSDPNPISRKEFFTEINWNLWNQHKSYVFIPITIKYRYFKTFYILVPFEKTRGINNFYRLSRNLITGKSYPDPKLRQYGLILF